MLFALITVISLATGIITYNITKTMVEENAIAAGANAETVSTKVPEDYTAAPSESTDDTAAFEHYTVRLEGEEIGIYVSHGGEEEFLYSHKVYKNDLSEHDLDMLKSGVKLYSASSLTGFLEDFTS